MKPVYVIKPQWFMGSHWIINSMYLRPDKPVKILELLEWDIEGLPFRHWAKVIHYDTQLFMSDFVPVAYIKQVAKERAA